MTTPSSKLKITENAVAINVGPQHPATHGTLRQRLLLDGETILSCDPDIGFLHTGFEKLAEHMTYNQFITVTDRMNYLSSLNNNIGFALAVEGLLGIEITPRCQWIRVILAELSRIADHVVCVGLAGMDMGAFSVMTWLWLEREKCYDIFDAVAGTRLTTGYTRIGGLLWDVPVDFEPRVRQFVEGLDAVLVDTERMLSGNQIFIGRTKGVGAIPKEDLLDYGVTGPLLRAAGVEYDVRRAWPYLGYDELEFDVPTFPHGDVYDRYLQRIEEIRQSARIIWQALDRLKDFPPAPTPKGWDPDHFRKLNPPNALANRPQWEEFKARHGQEAPDPGQWDDHKHTLPHKGKSNRPQTMEDLIVHFKQLMDHHGYEVPSGTEFYHATEAPNGELGWYVVAGHGQLREPDGAQSVATAGTGEAGGRPWRVRVRPPSLINYQAFPDMVEGHMISDLVAVLASLNIIAGELDR